MALDFICNKQIEEGKPIEKLKMVDDEHEGGNLSRGFECNICLDLAHDPVVTYCGHLYCWPCIYKWIHLHSIPCENPAQRHPQCPVCKAHVSQTTMVPLYGRDQATKTSQDDGMAIPERPQQFHHRSSTSTIGETAHAERVDGNSFVPYPNAHHLAGTASLRMRRQQLQADDKSLRRVHFFLFCCVVLCLILL
ncbi:RING-finger E3 ubiquitin ligase Makibishi 1 [Solanum lycopersicum]|nr:RING-finger E3 ubiquitin ligase Makibishi 1 [Solanum lycopersicum]